MSSVKVVPGLFRALGASLSRQTVHDTADCHTSIWQSGERHDLSPWLCCEQAGACRGESLARNRTIFLEERGAYVRRVLLLSISRFMRRVLYHGAPGAISECNQAVDSAHNLDPDLALGAFLWCGTSSELSLQKKLSAKIGTSCDVPLWHTKCKCGNARVFPELGLDRLCHPPDGHGRP